MLMNPHIDQVSSESNRRSDKGRRTQEMPAVNKLASWFLGAMRRRQRFHFRLDCVTNKPERTGDDGAED